ncbi:MAG: twin-arginine translocase subunit TatC [Anaerolineae bacterium]|jgi:sec-independent protein translocase protein TatC|nr:twin-arginine translocase subunit TatC [Anaerolineae bacterium]MBT7325458.1 twin-arginine translocase subunit TatC [Anaerolineae bacterium]
MRKFFTSLWNKITSPFRFIGRVLGAPFRALKRFRAFLNEEPDDKPLLDAATDVFQSQEARSDFFDHIESLRKHLFRTLLVLTATVSIAFMFTRNIIEYLAKTIGGTGALSEITPTESIGVFMRVALMSGIVMAIPYIASEFWLFFAPGLKPRSKKSGLYGIPFATLLFVTGVAFSYRFLLPPALNFLLTFMETEKNWSLSYYINFTTNIMFWIGVFFEFPLVIYALSAIGVVKPRVLQEQWRLAMVIIAILAAAITPTVDPVNMALVMMPMALLYFFSIGLGKLGYRSYLKNLKEKEEK